MSLAFQIFSSRIGEILVAGSSYAVTHVMQGDDRNRLASDFHMKYEGGAPFDRSGYIREACSVIANYLNGESQRNDIAIQVEGSEFERRVWNELRQIPYGKTTSYSAIAESIGAPDAFRAVANACGSNPVPLIIPCHRVIHKNGDISGFAWGDDAKRFLLDMERQAAFLSVTANAVS
jgi:AraC family transcriptional regulator of adaptative response/methylated-DNA-[protein]-cysteine methyltransferase